MRVILDKHRICSNIFRLLIEELGGDLCTVFDYLPITSSDYNDDLGEGIDTQLRVGDHGYYTCSSAKQKRVLLTQLSSYNIKSVICEGKYIRPTEIIDETHL